MHKDEKESPWLETSTKAMVQKFDSFMMSQNYIKTNGGHCVYMSCTFLEVAHSHSEVEGSHTIRRITNIPFDFRVFLTMSQKM